MEKLSRNIFKIGIRQVFYNFKFVSLLWSLGAITALIISMPVFQMMQESLKTSLLNDKLAAGFEYLWLVQFREIFSVQIDSLHYLFLAVLLGYLMIQNFYSGGLIAVFNMPKKNHMLDFFYGGVRYWYRFLKILSISLIFYGIAFLFNDLLAMIIHKAFVNSENAMAEFILNLLKYIILIFLIGITAIISDYAKVIVVVGDERSSVQSIKKAIVTIKNNFNTIFSVFVIISVTGALGAIVYNAVGRFIPRTPYYFLALTFIMQQMLVIFRLLIRMLFYSSEVLIYKDTTAEIIENNIQEVRS